MTPQQAAVVEKRRVLRQEYGGLMSVKNLTHELGFHDPRAAKRWAVTHKIRAVRMPANAGRACIRYDTDHVAKVLMSLSQTADMML